MEEGRKKKEEGEARKEEGGKGVRWAAAALCCNLLNASRTADSGGIHRASTARCVWKITTL